MFRNVLNHGPATLYLLTTWPTSQCAQPAYMARPAGARRLRCNFRAWRKPVWRIELADGPRVAAHYDRDRPSPERPPQSRPGWQTGQCHIRCSKWLKPMCRSEDHPFLWHISTPARESYGSRQAAASSSRRFRRSTTSLIFQSLPSTGLVKIRNSWSALVYENLHRPIDTSTARDWEYALPEAGPTPTRSSTLQSKQATASYPTWAGFNPRTPLSFLECWRFLPHSSPTFHLRTARCWSQSARLQVSWRSLEPWEIRCCCSTTSDQATEMRPRNSTPFTCSFSSFTIYSKNSKTCNIDRWRLRRICHRAQGRDGHPRKSCTPPAEA